MPKSELEKPTKEHGPKKSGPKTMIDKIQAFRKDADILGRDPDSVEEFKLWLAITPTSDKQASAYTDFVGKYIKENKGSSIGDAAKAWTSQKGKSKSKDESKKSSVKEAEDELKKTLNETLEDLVRKADEAEVELDANPDDEWVIGYSRGIREAVYSIKKVLEHKEGSVKQAEDELLEYPQEQPLKSEDVYHFDIYTYRDKTYGNNYWSSIIYKNNEEIGRKKFDYGDSSHAERESINFLIYQGFISPPDENESFWETKKRINYNFTVIPSSYKEIKRI